MVGKMESYPSLPSIMSPLEDDELHTALNWDGIAERQGPVEYFRVSVLHGEGYNEAFLWLSRHIT